MPKKTIARTKVSQPETANNGRAVSPAPVAPVAPASPAVKAAPIVKTAAKNPAPVKLTPTRDEIARRAYELYVARGKASGREVEDWVQAERELLGREHRNN